MVLCISAAMAYCSKPPAGKAGIQAEALKERMVQAAGFRQWQKTAAVSFRFSKKHDIFWDKGRGLVEVKWGDNQVQFEKKSLKGIAFVENKKAMNQGELIKKAYSYFVNDTFWLNPAYHLNSPGAMAYLVSANQLLVKYKSGGVTPGDSYLFTLDSQNRIDKMKMWVSIIPIKGIEADFQDYVKTATGVEIATSHKAYFLNIRLDDLKMYATYPGKNPDRFAPLLREL